MFLIKIIFLSKVITRHVAPRVIAGPGFTPEPRVDGPRFFLEILVDRGLVDRGSEMPDLGPGLVDRGFGGPGFGGPGFGGPRF